MGCGASIDDNGSGEGGRYEDDSTPLDQQNESALPDDERAQIAAIRARRRSIKRPCSLANDQQSMDHYRMVTGNIKDDDEYYKTEGLLELRPQSSRSEDERALARASDDECNAGVTASPNASTGSPGSPRSQPGSPSAGLSRKGSILRNSTTDTAGSSLSDSQSNRKSVSFLPSKFRRRQPQQQPPAPASSSSVVGGEGGGGAPPQAAAGGGDTTSPTASLMILSSTDL